MLVFVGVFQWSQSKKRGWQGSLMNLHFLGVHCGTGISGANNMWSIHPQKFHMLHLKNYSFQGRFIFFFLFGLIFGWSILNFGVNVEKQLFPPQIWLLVSYKILFSPRKLGKIDFTQFDDLNRIFFRWGGEFNHHHRKVTGRRAFFDQCVGPWGLECCRFEFCLWCLQEEKQKV